MTVRGSAARGASQRLRAASLVLAVAIGSFALYLSNAQRLASYDSVPNSLLAFNLLRDHRLDFDLFRGGYFNALGGQYAFAEAPNGHLASVFPIGTAIVTLPLYAAFWLGSGAGLPPIESPAFEPFRVRYEQIAAAAVAAVSVALFLLCARQLANSAQAAIATAVYALATSIWSIASQALWQHGPVNVLVLAMVYALLRAGCARRPAGSAAWLIAAGLCAGLLPVIRPTAGAFGAAGLLFAGWTFGARALFFAGALAIGAAPGAAWNTYFYHSLLGGYAGYAGIEPAYIFSARRALMAFTGLLVSPSRGIFVFSPVLTFSLAGAAALRRARGPNARLVVFLAAAAAAIVVQYAFFNTWWGGYAYGPRYLCDIDAIAALLLLYVIPKNPVAFSRTSAAAAAAAAVFALTFLFSVTVQFVGVNSGAAGSEWNAVPVSVDRRPERVWPLADNQVERNLRAAYFRFFAWDLARSPGYERGLAAHVTALTPSFAQVGHGTLIDAMAVLRNDGRSPVYGYDTGVYVGQMRVRVRIRAAQGQTYSEQYLYIGGAPAAGDQAYAVGTLAMPRDAGSYTLECEPVLVGGGAFGQGQAPFRIVVSVR